ncbi:MAG: trypsin-like peptidase domain-containing protein [Caldilineaceae bacterium]
MIEPKPRSSHGIVWIATGVITLLFFSCIFSLVGIFLFITPSRTVTSRNSQVPSTTTVAARTLVLPTPQPVVIIATPTGGDYESAALMNIYTQVNPSVINVTVLKSGQALEQVAPSHTFRADDMVPISTGSGFVWDTDGHLVTNYHVVEGADQVQVTFNDGAMAVAEVIGVDVDSDLAVLKIDPEGYNLAPVKLGNLDEVRVGMRVAAIGNPFGLQGTLTSGIVSAIGRSIPARENYSIPDSIQTDAAINPGNSGGPLLDDRGEVIGVNAQIRSEREANSGVGFAIPVALVQRVVPTLISKGLYKHSYIGVAGATLSPICADDLGLPKTLRGAYINQILDGAPAARAGLHAGARPSNTKYYSICPENTGGDVILAINDQTVTSFDEVLIYMERFTSPGDKVMFKVLRDGKPLLVDVTLGERPKQMTP